MIVGIKWNSYSTNIDKISEFFRIPDNCSFFSVSGLFLQFISYFSFSMAFLFGLFFLQHSYSPISLFLGCLDFIIEHGIIIMWTGITCKKIPSYMRELAWWSCIVENSKIFWSYVKIFDKISQVGMKDLHSCMRIQFYQSYFLIGAIKEI